MKNEMNINAKAIGRSLKSITEAEYIYMGHCMGMRDNIQNLIKRFSLVKKDVCEKFGVPPRKYNDFVKGNYNYSMDHMARLNAWFMELEMEKLKEAVPVRVEGVKK